MKWSCEKKSLFVLRVLQSWNSDIQGVQQYNKFLHYNLHWTLNANLKGWCPRFEVERTYIGYPSFNTNL